MSSCVEIVVVAAAERRPFGAELDQVVVRLRGRRMIGGRPHRAAPDVAQVDELAARIARRVAARPRDREAAAEAAAAAGVGDDRDVVAVRQELRVRKDRVRRCDTGAPAWRRAARRRASRPAGAARSSACGAARAPAAAARWPAPRVGVKPLHHAIAEQRVRQRDQGHALRGAPCRCGTTTPARPRRGRARSSRVGVARRCSRWRRRTVVALEARARPAAAGWPRSARASIIAASAVA